MATYKYFENSPERISALALFPMVLGLGAVLLARLLPADKIVWTGLLNSGSGLTDTALYLTHSAGLIGGVAISVLLLAVFATRRRFTAKYRLAESLAIATTAVVFVGGGALLNEHIVKEELKYPRPNIQWLATSDGGNALGMSALEFYQLGGKQDRAARLKPMLANAPPAVTDVIKQHWLAETGYSFPSGHSYSAFLLATLFLFLAVTFLDSRRRLLFYLLVPWAVAVAYSRVALMVHTPLDIAVGAVSGFIVGIIAWLVARSLIRLLSRSEIV